MKARSGHLYQRKPGGNWYVQIRVDGNTITRCTGTPNRREAEKRRAEIIAPFAIGHEAEVLEAVTTRLTGRKAELAKIEDEQNPPPPLARIWRLFERSPGRPDSGEATLKQYAAEWKRFAAWLAEHHPQAGTLRDVTPDMAADYARDLTAAKVSASTFNQHRNLLRMVWRVLADECRLTGNPWDRITPKKLNSLATRKRAITPAQFDSLLAAVEGEPDLKDLFTVLAWTGLRLADAVLIRWGSVDFPRRVISLAPMKTARRQGKIVHIPMFPAVLDVMNRQQAGRVMNPKAHVFPTLATQYERDASAISKAISAAFEKAGMQTTEDRADRKKAVVVFGAHSLRHYFVTQAAAAGMPAAMIKSITGHATDGMLERYQQIGAELAGELAGRIQGAAMLPETTPTGADALRGQLDALRSRIRELADRLDGKNWRTIKAALAALSDSGNTVDNGNA